MLVQYIASTPSLAALESARCICASLISGRYLAVKHCSPFFVVDPEPYASASKSWSPGWTVCNVQRLHLPSSSVADSDATRTHFPFRSVRRHTRAELSHWCSALASVYRVAPRRMMAIAAEASSPSARHARVAPGNLFRRISAQAMGMEAAALCHRSHWVPKSSRSSCSNCRRSFRLWAGKHHCRLCGEIVCGACSTKRILFQSKSVRTCDDCVDANVQNILGINRRQSTPEFLRSNTSPAAFGDYDAYERRSLQSLPLRVGSSRGLHRHHSSFAASSSTSLGSRRGTTSSNNKEAETSSSKEMTVMNYRITFSWQTQVMSLVIAALIACALKLMAQV